MHCNSKYYQYARDYLNSVPINNYHWLKITVKKFVSDLLQNIKTLVLVNNIQHIHNLLAFNKLGNA